MEDTTRKIEINQGYVKIKNGGHIYCHTRMAENDMLECQTDCAAYYAEDGYARCFMMRGTRIIGRIITQDERK